MKNSNIKWLHIEASSKCNAWCPACPRNQNGYGIAPGLVEQDLTTARLQQVLDQLGPLDGVQFCGNYGDPIACNHLLELIELVKPQTNKIQIHTNGSLRSTKWWSELANQLVSHEHDVWFGIDGIGSVHEIYRQATSYSKIIENAQAFIDAGGQATWQFIPYAHNEHQLKDVMRLSRELGFKNFKAIKSFRPTQNSRHWKTGEEFKLEPSNLYQTVFFKPKQGVLKEENCMHLSQPGIYLAANGQISPCCHLAQHHDYTKSFDTVNEMLCEINIKETLDNPIPKCLIACGT